MSSLELADGTLIDTTTGRPIKDEPDAIYVEVPNYADTQRQIVSARSRVADFPVPPSQMTSIGILLFYSTLGISDDEISSLTSLTIDQIGRIRISDTYNKVQEDFINKIIESDVDNVRTMFVDGSRRAASRIITLVDSQSETMQLAAAKDILDRAGQRPADVVEHRHRMENTLRIEVVKKDTLEDIPIIEGEIL